MSESTQQIAKRVLQDLDALVAQGKLQSFHLGSLRSDLEPLANPPPPPIVARKPPPPPAHAQRKRYRAIWSYNGVEADELSFSENEQIELIQEVSEGWWRGCVVRSDQSRSEEGLFPSNYVEVIPDNVIGTVDLPPLPPRNNAVFSPSNGLANTDDEKRAMGFHAPNMPVPYGNYHNNDGQLGPPHWQPGMTRWNSGGPPPMPPPPPSNFAPSPGPQSPPPSQNGSYYNQPPMPYGGATPEAYGPPQPHVPTEEEKKKHDKIKKFAGRMGETMAGGFAGGVGFGIGSHLF